MFETIVEKIVNEQLASGAISEEDRNIYLYGYQMLIEFAINIITSISIAFIFRAYWVVLMFTIAYLLIRGYVGGYHAKTSLGCFCMSAGMLVLVVIGVRYINNTEIKNWLFCMEVIMMPWIIGRTPIPDVNKPITENERIHFNKKVKQIYSMELLLELLLLWMKKDIGALSILAVHIVLFIMVMVDVLCKHRQQTKDSS